MSDSPLTLVSDDKPHEETESTMKLTDFKKIEGLVNEYAKAISHKHHVKPDDFVIHLHSSLKGIMMLVAGPQVQIELLWPHAQPTLNSLLRSAFDSIRRHALKRTFQVVPIALVKSFDEENRRMYREKFGEVGDIMPDLISRQRLRMTVETTTTLMDTKTGEKVSITHKDKATRYDGNLVSMWLQLSRIVRENHHEAILEDDTDSVTPILDAALGEG